MKLKALFYILRIETIEGSQYHLPGTSGATIRILSAL